MMMMIDDCDEDFYSRISENTTLSDMLAGPRKIFFRFRVTSCSLESLRRVAVFVKLQCLLDRLHNCQCLVHLLAFL